MQFDRFFLYLIDLRNNAKEEKLRMLLGNKQAQYVCPRNSFVSDPTGEERRQYCDSLSKTILSTSNSTRKEVVPLHPVQPYQELDDGTYSCSFCNRCYKQLGSLAKHLDTNHAITNAVSFKCPKCQKSFESKFQLTRHGKTCKL